MTDLAKLRELLDKYATVGTTSEELTQLVSLREKLTPALLSEVEKLRAAATQASFCLRELLPNDSDAQMTVRMLHQALGETK